MIRNELLKIRTLAMTRGIAEPYPDRVTRPVNQQFHPDDALVARVGQLPGAARVAVDASEVAPETITHEVLLAFLQIIEIVRMELLAQRRLSGDRREFW
ncbi:hypothetical protein J5277_17620 [Rhizobium sp. 16-449-1b]|uniref:hypothetical protein n=1 Tax=Rhizobium sp. 16-449-1b TaxID=2819989 RepID=UPI001ADD1E1F|nr:hypothetical protein [Rhizobium sp. 16-449-1b]MBO9195926.1 hypothetical protein [Rhizobium sp. 16-449-1b]